MSAAAAARSDRRPPHAPAGAVAVDVVCGRRDRKRFLRLPWRIYAGDAAWVPPLLADQKKLLDRDRHPFHEHADVDYFLARRPGDARGEADVVGRIAVIVNHRYNEFHGERTGFFGFFESVEEPAVARALLTAAEDWLARRGMERVLGPMNFSTNEDCGLLVDGFEYPPAVMMPHNPPYYAGLMEDAGYAKAKDLLAYWLEGPEPPERLVRGVERLRRRADVSVRTLDKRRFDEEVARIQEVYNSAWERNWGFVPMTDAEFRHLARDLRPVVEPELCLIAEAGDEPVGFALALPDFNQALKHINGRLLPFGLLKLLWYKRKVDTARIITLGLKPAYRRKGLDAVFYLRLFRNGVPLGYTRAECSWILDDNWDMRRGLERLGARVYKTYRVYEKPVG